MYAHSFSPLLQAVQAAIIEQQPKMEALSTLSHSMAGSCSPEDSFLLGEKQAQLVSAVESLQRSAVGRKRLLEDGLAQAISFASAWAEAMGEIEEKRTELEHFETVGVDIDTVKAQLGEYKVGGWEGGAGRWVGGSGWADRGAGR